MCFLDPVGSCITTNEMSFSLQPEYQWNKQKFAFCAKVPVVSSSNDVTFWNTINDQFRPFEFLSVVSISHRNSKRTFCSVIVFTCLFTWVFSQTLQIFHWIYKAINILCLCIICCSNLPLQMHSMLGEANGLSFKADILSQFNQSASLNLIFIY